MIKMSHTALIYISGLIWLIIGFFLLQLGLKLLMGTLLPERMGEGFPLMEALAPYIGGIEQAAMMLIAIALFIGYAKGKYVLGKSAKRGVERILSFPNPTHLSNIYSAKYYILLGAMIGLGMSIKYLGLNHDIRGFIDVAIGAALMNGAMIYFRSGAEARKEIKS